MENLNFDNFMSVQVIDSGTANILGEYYIEGKYTDFKLTCLFIVFLGLLFFLFCIFTRDKF